MSLRVKKWKYMRKANSTQGNYCLFLPHLCKVAGNNFHKCGECMVNNLMSSLNGAFNSLLDIVRQLTNYFSFVKATRKFLFQKV